MRKFEMTKEATLEYLQRMIDLSGKKRFQKIFTIYMNLKDLTGSGLRYKYLCSVSDCWEASIFSDRLQNKGFQRYSNDVIDIYMDELINVLENSKNHGLIK